MRQTKNNVDLRCASTYTGPVECQVTACRLVLLHDAELTIGMTNKSPCRLHRISRPDGTFSGRISEKVAEGSWKDCRQIVGALVMGPKI